MIELAIHANDPAVHSLLVKVLNDDQKDVAEAHESEEGKEIGKEMIEAGEINPNAALTKSLPPGAL